jgi:hypothetical protein
MRFVFVRYFFYTERGPFQPGPLGERWVKSAGCTRDILRLPSFPPRSHFTSLHGRMLVCPVTRQLLCQRRSPELEDPGSEGIGLLSSSGYRTLHRPVIGEYAGTVEWRLNEINGISWRKATPIPHIFRNEYEAARWESRAQRAELLLRIILVCSKMLLKRYKLFGDFECWNRDKCLWAILKSHTGDSLSRAGDFVDEVVCGWLCV